MNTPLPSTTTLIAAMHALSCDIESYDGVANMAILDAAHRLEKMRSLLSALVGKGLMEMHEPSELSGGSQWFVVTDAGRAYVDEHSKQAPKLTAAQKRYREYLRIADMTGLTFGQWLKRRVVEGQIERA
jgi:hypothetical protein